MRKTPRLTRAVAASLIGALASLPAHALRPDAGTILQDVRPQPAAPSGNADALPGTSPRPAQPLDNTVRIAVTSIHFTGAQAIPEAELQALVAPALGKQLTLAELDDIAQRVTQRYRDDGYLLARAYLPAQEIRDGRVEIAILEGRLGKLTIDNRSGISGRTVAAYLGDLQPGEALSGETLERDILLLADLPATEVTSTLRPGASVGTTDLDLQLMRKTPYGGGLELDNFGNRFIGDWRLGGNVNLGNLTGLADTLSLRAVASSGLRYGRLAWQLPVGAAGTQLGAAWSEMNYTLGKDFDALGAHGNATIGSLYLLHPLIRSRLSNLNGQAVLERKRLADTIDQSDTQTHKSIDVWTVGLSGDHFDGLLGSGASQGSLSIAAGHLNLDAQSQSLDQSGLHTAGGFVRANLALARSQRLSEALTLFGSLRAQAANKNLDTAEKMPLGGPQGVRAYPQGEAPSDDAWLATLELRYTVAGTWQASLFYDKASGRNNHEPLAGDRSNVRQLGGYGLGLTRSAADIGLQLGIAWRDGEAPTSDVERHPRIWFQAVKRF